jgi:hypothetical protein
MVLVNFAISEDRTTRTSLPRSVISGIRPKANMILEAGTSAESEKRLQREKGYCESGKCGADRF